MVFLFAKEVESLAGVKYTAKEKTVQKMTRDGLTEEHIGDGQKKDVPDKSRGRPAARLKNRFGRRLFDRRRCLQKKALKVPNWSGAYQWMEIRKADSG